MSLTTLLALTDIDLTPSHTVRPMYFRLLSIAQLGKLSAVLYGGSGLLAIKTSETIVYFPKDTK